MRVHRVIVRSHRIILKVMQSHCEDTRGHYKGQQVIVRAYSHWDGTQRHFEGHKIIVGIPHSHPRIYRVIYSHKVILRTHSHYVTQCHCKSTKRYLEGTHKVIVRCT